jgi:5'-deoxy-5'-methylthioadenosine phosphorylase
MTDIDLAIIGGTGIARIQGLEVTRQRIVRTPFGEPSAPILRANLGGRDAYFLARHGSGHTIPPHRVNYRANLWALRELGARRIAAISAVGGIHPDLGPGELAVPDQIIDYTWGRPSTIFDDVNEPVQHVEFTEPYSAELRCAILAAADRAGVEVRNGGVYGATQGPRLETAAEIERMRRDGCDMVGMTGMPEAVIARELEVAYAGCALVINRAAGCGDGDIHGEIERHVDDCMASVRSVLVELMERGP